MSQEACPTNRCSQRQYLWGIFCLEEAGDLYHPNEINSKHIAMSLWFPAILKAYNETIKKSKDHLLKNNKSHFLTILPY